MTSDERDLLRLNLDTAMRWVRHAQAHGVALECAIALSEELPGGGRAPVIYSTPEDEGCVDAIRLIEDIADQLREGCHGTPSNTIVPGEQVRRESVEISRQRGRGVCLLCGESHGPAEPCRPPTPV